MDELDRQILDRLSKDGREANRTTADALHVAASTTLNRVRRLVDTGVIRGFHADVDPASLGRPLQAMISVRLQSDARGAITEFQSYLSKLDHVRHIYFLAGSVDFLVHVAVRDSPELRSLVVDHLNSRPEVSMTETSLIFGSASGPSRDGVSPRA